MCERALASARDFAGVLTGKLCKALDTLREDGGSWRHCCLHPPSKEWLPAQQPQQMWLCVLLPHARSLLQVLLQVLVASYRERWEHFLAMATRYRSLSGKIFRALAMCISQQSCLSLDNFKLSVQWALTLSGLESPTLQLTVHCMICVKGNSSYLLLQRFHSATKLKPLNPIMSRLQAC